MERLRGRAHRWNTTFAGLWLTWAGALVLTLAGLGTRRRA
ncbi:MAG: LPXTG cell wall anchor domain-containing protein [Myxococcales bacterium]|nr:LPXTG cell wall anchor domain-containing protein [Myxococcales bacterium]MCB9578386.1 LPXTG cell wall anchor domain-containing protein [Polyangiaceae bacterium]